MTTPPDPGRPARLRAHLDHRAATETWHVHRCPIRASRSVVGLPEGVASERADEPKFDPEGRNGVDRRGHARNEALDPHVASCRIVGGVEEHLAVGRVAELAGVSVRTLHHYDEIGLVQPSARTAAGYRAYCSGDVERLREVLTYRRLGFGLRARLRIWLTTRPPTRSHICTGCAACCWTSATALLPWRRPSTGSWRHGQWGSA